MLMDEPQPPKELLPVLESEEAMEAMLVPPFEGALVAGLTGLRCLSGKEMKKLQRRSPEETSKCKPRRRRLARNFLLL